MDKPTNLALERRLPHFSCRSLSPRIASPTKTPAVAVPVNDRPCTRRRRKTTWRQTAPREASTKPPSFLSNHRRFATGNIQKETRLMFELLAGTASLVVVAPSGEQRNDIQASSLGLAKGGSGVYIQPGISWMMSEQCYS